MTKTNERRNIWLIEDNQSFRRALSKTIDAMPAYHCAANFSTAEDALAALEVQSAPELILLDIGLPGMNGISAMKPLRAASPALKIIILTVFDDHNRIFGAICAGADGYLLKTSSAEEIARAIEEVLSGGASMTPQIARKVLELMSNTPPKATVPKSPSDLSLREQDVLKQVVRGLTKDEIARALKLSPHTIDTHLRNIYQKLHVHNRAGAVAIAIRDGLV